MTPESHGFLAIRSYIYFLSFVGAIPSDLNAFEVLVALMVRWMSSAEKDNIILSVCMFLWDRSVFLKQRSSLLACSKNCRLKLSAGSVGS